MPNPANQKVTENVAEKVHDATDRFAQNVDDYQENAQRMADKAADRVNEVYQGASEWLQENPGRAIGFAALFVGVSLLGFFVGRSFRGGEQNIERY
jgi:ElaB/YqjD/DUF883 family membrane-anchored ribosome-binding protein